jgi:hypothetical protein
MLFAAFDPKEAFSRSLFSPLRDCFFKLTHFPDFSSRVAQLADRHLEPPEGLIWLSALRSHNSWDLLNGSLEPS